MEFKVRKRYSASRQLAWHPRAEAEALELRTAAPRILAVLAQRLRSLVDSDGDRWGCPGAGRIMKSTIADSPVVVVLYVVRRDGAGLGILLWHEMEARGGKTVPDHVYRLAQSRLDDMPGW